MCISWWRSNLWRFGQWLRRSFMWWIEAECIAVWLQVRPTLSTKWVMPINSKLSRTRALFLATRWRFFLFKATFPEELHLTVICTTKRSNRSAVKCNAAIHHRRNYAKQIRYVANLARGKRNDEWNVNLESVQERCLISFETHSHSKIDRTHYMEQLKAIQMDNCWQRTASCHKCQRICLHSIAMQTNNLYFPFSQCAPLCLSLYRFAHISTASVFASFSSPNSLS